jgi:predicted CXXCH cytochrome family protein
VDFQCGKCHGSDPGQVGTMLLTSVADGLCRDCHKDISKDVAYAHAPVLVNACLQCHEPHLSNGPGLLLTATPNVCVRCHYPTDLSTGDHHRDAASPTDSTCIACHLPHGGPRRHLLRTAGG